MINFEPGGVAEIATALGVSRSTVSMWSRRREVTHFPSPRWELQMGPIYDMREVREWASSRTTGSQR